MKVKLHAHATTTPKVRQMIQASSDSVPDLARRFGVTAPTIRKWKQRDSTEDRSHTPHHLQTTLTPAQEILVVELRTLLLLPLDDLLAVTREFIIALRPGTLPGPPWGRETVGPQTATAGGFC